VKKIFDEKKNKQKTHTAHKKQTKKQTATKIMQSLLNDNK
jgi:hypothetical protein